MQSNVNALIDMKLEKHKNLGEESAFFWREINDGTLRFDRRDFEVRLLNPLYFYIHLYLLLLFLSVYVFVHSCLYGWHGEIHYSRTFRTQIGVK